MGDVAGHDVVQFVGVDHGDGGSDFCPRLAGVAHHDDFVKELLVHVEGDIDECSVRYRNFHGLETDCREDQNGISVRHSEGIRAVCACDRAVHRALFHNAGSDHGLPGIRSGNGTLDRNLRIKLHRCQQQGEEKDQSFHRQIFGLVLLFDCFQ